MVNGTNALGPDSGYEYYLDYLDFAPVDERKLRAHKRESQPGRRPGSGYRGLRASPTLPVPCLLGCLGERA